MVKCPIKDNIKLGVKLGLNSRLNPPSPDRPKVRKQNESPDISSRYNTEPWGLDSTHTPPHTLKTSNPANSTILKVFTRQEMDFGETWSSVL